MQRKVRTISCIINCSERKEKLIYQIIFIPDLRLTIDCPPAPASGPLLLLVNTLIRPVDAPCFDDVPLISLLEFPLGNVLFKSTTIQRRKNNESIVNQRILLVIVESLQNFFSP